MTAAPPPEKPEEKQILAADPRGFSLRWHLACTPAEIDTTALEFALMRTYEGFGRWQAEAFAACSDLPATGPENAMLHIIAMNGRPKTLKDLARLTNRDDVPNIQYSLRKLIGAGLVLRQGAGRSGVTYEATPEGHRTCADFAAIRRRTLIAAVEQLPGFAERLAEAARSLNLLTGIYEEAARMTATHRVTGG